MSHELVVKNIPVDDLVPYAGNARIHSNEQVEQIAVSINAFGFINPILIDESNRVVAGHARLLAAKSIGLLEVPVLRIEHLSKDEIRAYTIADNKLAENADWNKDLLQVELEHLSRVDVDLNVDLTGFSMGEIDLLITPLLENDDEILPTVPEAPDTVSCTGDVWQIADHRIGCGDCRDREFVRTIMNGTEAQMVLTDPPYNVPIAGHARGLGRTQHPDFRMAAGEMSFEAFAGFLVDSLRPACHVSRDGALHFVFMDWRHVEELLAAAKHLYSEQLNLCVWSKTNGAMGSLYRSQHELVFVFKCGTGHHVNNVELGKHGRNRTNVWTYAGVNAFGKGRDEALAMHPTVKPVALVADAIMDVTHRGDVVYDGFLGSGTTIVAAHRTGRIGYGVELDPRYVDVAVRRVSDATGVEPVLSETGETFEDVAGDRRSTSEETDHG